MPDVPQPGVERIVPFGGHPLVAGVVPGGSELVVRTALSWAEALDVAVYFAYVDESRLTLAENADGTVRHSPIDPDADDDWQTRQARFEEWVGALCAGQPVRWQTRYLAGRPDRALTHLARTVDAAAFVIGAHGTKRRWRPDEFLDASIAVRLSHHQHRPVMIVPQAVVDWKAKTPWQ